MSKKVRTRIAPSPTGQLHIGSLATALRNYAFAKQNGGEFIIRIEDTDRERLVEGAVEATLKVLGDYGLSWDEGPDKGGPFGPYIQSERLHIYKEYSDKLVAVGKAYPCFCTKERLDEMRQTQQQAGKLPKYDRHCLSLSKSEIDAKIAAGIPHVIRLKVPDNQTITVTDLIRGEIKFNTASVDDQVLLKSDGFPTYHLGVVVDDNLMQITHIIRGEEWISSTPKHILLYQAFGWEVPVYAHTPIFLSPTGKGKMSKRQGDVSARYFLESGYLPEAILNFLMIMGWSPKTNEEFFTLPEFVKLFDLESISKKSVAFDIDKLDWINGHYIRQTPDDKLLNLLKPHFPPNMDETIAQKVLPLVKERLVKLKDFTDWTVYFVTAPEINLDNLIKESKWEQREIKTYLANVANLLQTQTKWSPANLESVLRSFLETSALKPRPAFMTLRYVLTGQDATPPLFDVMGVLGKKESIARLETAQKLLD